MVKNDAFEVILAGLDIGPSALDAEAVTLSENERKRADRFVFQRDRRRFVTARAKLRRLIGARLRIAPEAVEFHYGANGKPALARHPLSEDLRFNVSHCEDVAVYALSYGREIGVDVEAICDLPDSDRVAKHCFSAFENKAYSRLNEKLKPEGFFNCWTRKEAFVKALGDGLSYPLSHFDVSLAPDRPAEILRVGNIPGDRCGWEIYSFKPRPGIVGAVVIEGLR
ncbi:MAG: 4'-phosphopantetheinyl transferase superfamily protein [Gammaproteobacteria bacterium]|nr:4'-phosphopantetheinyl transferase superfamily protein [Gammaproteobacteria bacterium]